MTGLLKDLMHDRADQAGSPHVDIDAIVANGDKRVRRRRVVTGVGVAAVAAAVIAAVAVVPGTFDNSGPDPVQPVPEPAPFSALRPTYAAGSSIHYGGETISTAPYTVAAFVQTDAGFVFSTPDHEIYLASGGDVEQLGATASDPAGDQRILVGAGPYAAWIDWSGAAPALVAYDTINGKELLRTPDYSTDGGDPIDTTTVVTIDGGLVYWSTSDGVVVSDVTSDAGPIMLREGARSDWLSDAQDGLFARATHDDQATTVSRSTDGDKPFVPGHLGQLSPKGTYVATSTFPTSQDEGLKLHVYKVSNQRAVAADCCDYSATLFGTWLDDDTFTAFASTGSGNVFDLLTCSAEGGPCEVVARDVPPIGPTGDE